MKMLKLSIKETKELEEKGSIEIVRNGFTIVVEGTSLVNYTIYVVNPYIGIQVNQR